jgi:hypothetical protein
MDALVDLGIFLALLGAFFIGCAAIWAVSIWAKQKEKE